MGAKIIMICVVIQLKSYLFIQYGLKIIEQHNLSNRSTKQLKKQDEYQLQDKKN